MSSAVSTSAGSDFEEPQQLRAPRSEATLLSSGSSDMDSNSAAKTRANTSAEFGVEGQEQGEPDWSSSAFAEMFEQSGRLSFDGASVSNPMSLTAETDFVRYLLAERQA